MEDGVDHLKTERAGVGSGRRPGDRHCATGRSTGGSIKREGRRERKGEGSKSTKGVVENTSETHSSTEPTSKDLRKSSKHFGIVNGG